MGRRQGTDQQMNPADDTELALIHELLIEMGHELGGDIPFGDLTVEQLDLDSLATVELLMLVEERTGIEVPVEPVTSGTTMAQLAELIRAQPAP